VLERRERLGVQSAARVAADDVEYLVGTERWPIGPVGTECLRDVRDGEDPRGQVQLSGVEPGEVPAAVQPLVVGSGDPRQLRTRAPA
jgi:hypothetical protein